MYKRRDSGLSLVEALIALGLLLIFIIPALNMIRQSASIYSRAYEDYQTDLALAGLLAEAKSSAETNDFIDITLDFPDGGYFEYEVIIMELLPQRIHIIKYPAGAGLDIQPAGLGQAGDFTGIISAAVKDTRNGVVKTGVMPY